MGGGKEGEKGIGNGEGERQGGFYRTSHKRPSEAVCFFVASSFRTRDWRVDELAGEESWRSRTFCETGGDQRFCSLRGSCIGETMAGGMKRPGRDAYFYIANHIVLDGCECH